jgi:hypothetical protein
MKVKHVAMRGRRGPAAVGLLAGLTFVVLTAVAQAPSWWTNRNVLATNTASHDFAVLNQGQLKWLASQAYMEFDEQIPWGAGANLASLLLTFSTTNNVLPVNLGQLKYVAQPFYDRLIELSATNAYPTNASNPYPWSGSITPPQDYALANVGQAKYLFSFDLSGVTFSTNGTANNVVHALPDWWLMQRGLKPYPTNSTPDTTAPVITVVEPVDGGTL